MSVCTNSLRMVRSILLGLCVLVGMSTVGKATVIDFDAVDTSSPPTLGVDPTSYLAGFGVTLSNVTGGTTMGVKTTAFDTNLILVSSPNYMSQWWGGINGVSYDLMFAQPLVDLSVSIPEITSGVAVPKWSFTAINASGTPLTTSVGQTIFSGASARRTFLFDSTTDPGLQGLRIYTDVGGFAGMGGIPIDDVVFTVVPEPSMLVLLFTGGIGLACYRVPRKRR